MNLDKEVNKILNIKKSYIIKKDYEKASIYKEKENKLTSKINKLELKLSKEKNNIVTKEDVINVVSTRCNIPIYELKDYDIKYIKK